MSFSYPCFAQTDTYRSEDHDSGSPAFKVTLSLQQGASALSYREKDTEKKKREGLLRIIMSGGHKACSWGLGCIFPLPP